MDDCVFCHVCSISCSNASNDATVRDKIGEECMTVKSTDEAGKLIEKVNEKVGDKGMMCIRLQIVREHCIHNGSTASGMSGEEVKETHAHESQSHVVILSMDRLVVGVAEVILAAVDDSGNSPYVSSTSSFTQNSSKLTPKIICFFPTALLTKYYAIFSIAHLITLNLQIHANNPASSSKRINTPSISHQYLKCIHDAANREEIKNASGILFTSDVSARGVDYPNVTHVIQFGLSSSREQ